MMRHRNPEVFLAKLWALEDALVAAGFPAMPEWWRKEIARFERSGKRRMVVRKGRRVFASTCVAPRLAVCEMLFGDHPHLPGTPAHVYAFLSVKRDEAAKRLVGVRAILDVLGEPYQERGDTIELTSRPAVFAVVTANFRTNVGDTVAVAWCDEVARWSDAETGSNPARAVIGSLAPALATLPDAHLWLVSTPLTKDDYHARAFDRGEDAGQCVAFGATWTINPSLSEAETRALEPDEDEWLNNYAAIPRDTVKTNFFGQGIECARDVGRTAPMPMPDGIERYIPVDQSESKDSYGIAPISHQVGAWDEETRSRGPSIVTVHEVIAWRPDRRPLDMILRVRNEVLQRYKTNHVYIDQFSGAAFRDLCAMVNVKATVVPWTGGTGEERDDPEYRRHYGDDLPRASKLARYRMVRLAMLNGTFRIPDDAELLKELRSVESHITPSGNEVIVLPRSGGNHCDRVSAMVLGGSVALMSRPCLAPSRETWFEARARRQREAEERNTLERIAMWI